MSGFRCLAMETGVPKSSVAVSNGERQCELWLPSGGRVAAALFETIDRALAEVELTLANLDCVAFGRGPGAFTGLRVAAAAAQGLGAGLGVKLCAVSSLAALAQDAQERAAAAARSGREDRFGGGAAFQPEAWIAPCLPAGREDVYMGWYQTDSAGLVTRGREDWLAPVPSCRPPGTESFIAVGSVWAERESLRSGLSSRILRIEERALPRAGAILRLARRDYVEGRVVDAERAQPVYLRRAV